MDFKKPKLEFVIFKRRIVKSGNTFYISVPKEFIENGYLEHGKLYEVILKEVKKEKDKDHQDFHSNEAP